jgi:hypothetical protein
MRLQPIYFAIQGPDMKFVFSIFRRYSVQLCGDRSMIKGGANTGNRDSMNSYYEYDGR